MNVFQSKQVPVYGKVMDLNGALIPTPAVGSLEVIVEQTYGTCAREFVVPVENGYFQTYFNPMSDNRSFISKIKLNSSQYLKIE